MRRLLFVSVFVAYLSACTVNTRRNLSFDLGSFRQQELYRGEAELLTLDSLLLGRPSALRFHPEGFLIVMDSASSDQVSVIDLKDSGTQSFIKRGRGPFEAIATWDVTMYDGDVWVSGVQEKKMIRLKLDRFSRKFHIEKEIDLSASGFSRALPYSASEFLIMSKASSGKRMEIVTDAGESVKDVGSFPDVRIAGDKAPNNFWLQSQISISPNRQHAAVCYLSVDYIDIYDGKMTLGKRLRGPVGADPEFFERELSIGTQFIQRPSYHFFNNIISNDTCFYVSYVGFEIKPGERPVPSDVEARRIFSFDWAGTPLSCYTFDHPVLCFAVDTEGEKMYVVTRNAETLESEIVIHNL
jgi:hypothetical protein